MKILPYTDIIVLVGCFFLFSLQNILSLDIPKNSHSSFFRLKKRELNMYLTINKI